MARRDADLAEMSFTPTARQRTFFARPPLDSPRLRVRGLGIGDVLPPCAIDRPRGTGDHLILCAHDALEVDAAGSAVAPGEVVLWRPGRRQFYRNRDGLRHSWIHCSGSIVDALVERSGLPAGSACAPGSRATCDRALDALRCELTGPLPDEEVAAGILQALLAALARNQRRDAAPAPPDAYLAARERIERGLAQRLHLPGLAAQAGVGVQHFGRTFRALFGDSPIAYQHRLRLEHAAFLLRDVARSVGSVAVEVGYADIYQFSRAFRRHFGASPLRWRAGLLASRVGRRR